MLARSHLDNMTIAESTRFRFKQRDLEGMAMVLQKIHRKIDELDTRLVAMENRMQNGKEGDMNDDRTTRIGSVETSRPITQLKRLREEDNFFTYVDAFVTLISQVELADEDQVALFVGGLSDNKKCIRVLNPKNLQQAISYAKTLTIDDQVVIGGSYPGENGGLSGANVEQTLTTDDQAAAEEICPGKNGDPSGVNVELLSVTNVAPGNSKLRTSHPDLKIEVIGSIEVQGNPMIGIHVYPFSPDVVYVDCSHNPAKIPDQGKAIGHALSNTDGMLTDKEIPCGTNELRLYCKGEPIKVKSNGRRQRQWKEGRCSRIFGESELWNMLKDTPPPTKGWEVEQIKGPVEVNLAVTAKILLYDGDNCMKKIDSLSRWVSKELGDVEDIQIHSTTGISWSAVEGENMTDESSLNHSKPQHQLFSITDFSSKGTHTDSDIQVLIIGKNYKEAANCNWSCMFGKVEVPTQILAFGLLTCRAPVAASGRWSVKRTSRDRDRQDQDSVRVRVVIRLRSKTPEDRLLDSDHGDCVELQPELKKLKLRKNNWNSISYRNDEVFTETTSQKRVYEVVAQPLVESVLDGYNGMDGYNGTIMAYGQTGNGKTYTVGHLGKEGPSQRGIIVRALEDILNNIPHSYDSVEVSYLQLYMESKQDLLSPEKTSILIVEDPITGTVTLPVATVVCIGDLDHFMELLQAGEANRHAANTKLITKSSRSHVVLMVNVRRSVNELRQDENLLPHSDKNSSPDVNDILIVRKSKLSVVDLAGTIRKVDISDLCKNREEESQRFVKPDSDGGFHEHDAKEHLILKVLRETIYSWLIYKVAEDGKDPYILDEQDQGVLHMVSALAYDWAIKSIVDAGVAINFRDVNGWTALYWDACCGKEHIVCVILSLEAAPGLLMDPSPEDSLGRTPADLVSANGHKGIFGFLAESSVTSYLSLLFADRGVGSPRPVKSASTSTYCVDLKLSVETKNPMSPAPGAVTAASSTSERNGGRRTVIKVSVHGQNEDNPVTAWEYVFDLQAKGPYYTLEDKGVPKGRVLMHENRPGKEKWDRGSSCNRICYARATDGGEGTQPAKQGHHQARGKIIQSSN